MFGRSELWCSVEFRGVLGLCEYLQTLQILEIWLGWGVGVVQRSRFLSIWAYYGWFKEVKITAWFDSLEFARLVRGERKGNSVEELYTDQKWTALAAA